LGYNVRISVPDELPNSRIAPIQIFGAEVVNVGSGYVPRASEVQAEEIQAFRQNRSWTESRPLTRSSRAFRFDDNGKRICYLNHSENDLSPMAFREIGKEILRSTEPDVVYLAAGNWTTIAGIAPVIHDESPGTTVIAYEGDYTSGPHTNYGTSVDGVKLRYRDERLVDDIVTITDQERDAVRNTNRYARNLGNSSIMGLAAAIRHGGLRPTTIAYDLANRY
jgi:cysteine synthase